MLSLLKKTVVLEIGNARKYHSFKTVAKKKRTVFLTFDNGFQVLLKIQNVVACQIASGYTLEV